MLWNSRSRTGTKLIIANWIVSVIIVVTLNIIFPLLGIWFENINKILVTLNVSVTTIALIGQSAITTSANEIRKAIENKRKDK